MTHRLKKPLLVIFAISCIVCTLFVLSIASSAHITGDVFSDVNSSAWYYDSVYYAYEHGYMEGTAQGVFAPDAPLTRGMMVKVLANVDYVDTAGYAKNSTFSDVRSGKWYHESVEWAASCGIVSGTSATTFSPSSNLTNQDACVILYNYARFKGLDITASASLEAYSDANNVSSYATNAVSWAVANGFIGNGTSTLAPKSNATRALIAYMFKGYDSSLGHKWDQVVVQQERTCYQDGKIRYTCSQDGLTRVATLKGYHSWVEQNITCSSSGCVRNYVCYSDSSHKYSKTVAHTWRLTQTITASTCEGYGKGVYTCTLCKGQYTGNIAKLGHDWYLESYGYYNGVKCEVYHCKRDWSHTDYKQIAPRDIRTDKFGYGITVNGSNFKMSSSLFSRLNTAISDRRRITGFYVVDLETGTTLGYNADVGFWPACTIKAGMALTAYKRMEAGYFNTQTLWTYQSKHYVGQSGTIQYSSFGTRFKAGDVLYRMIHISDNVAFYMASDYVGVSNYNRLVSDLGVKHLRSGIASWGSLTPQELGLIWQEIYKYRTQSSYGNALFSLFTNAQFNFIKQGLNYKYTVAHKSGWNDQKYYVYNDAGIVFGARPYIMVIMTNYTPGTTSHQSYLGSVARCLDDWVTEYNNYLKYNFR